MGRGSALDLGFHQQEGEQYRYAFTVEMRIKPMVDVAEMSRRAGGRPCELVARGANDTLQWSLQLVDAPAPVSSSADDGDDNRSRFGLQLVVGVVGGGGPVIVKAATDGGAQDDDDERAAAPIVAGKWSHVAAVVEASPAPRAAQGEPATVRLFVRGVQAAEERVKGQPPPPELHVQVLKSQE